MKLYIYNQNCPYAGRTVAAEVLERYDGDIDAAGDWSVFEGTPEELLAQADTYDRVQVLDGRKLFPYRYSMRVGKALRDAAYWEKPELKPDEDET